MGWNKTKYFMIQCRNRNGWDDKDGPDWRNDSGAIKHFEDALERLEKMKQIKGHEFEYRVIQFKSKWRVME